MTGSPLASPVSLPPTARSWMRRSAAVATAADGGSSSAASCLLDGWLQQQTDDNKDTEQQKQHQKTQQKHEPLHLPTTAAHTSAADLNGFLADSTTPAGEEEAAQAAAKKKSDATALPSTALQRNKTPGATASAKAAAGAAAGLGLGVENKLGMFKAAVVLRKARQEFERKRRQSLVALIQRVQQQQHQRQQQQQESHQQRWPKQQRNSGQQSEQTQQCEPGQQQQQQHGAATASVGGNEGPLDPQKSSVHQQQQQQNKRQASAAASRAPKSYRWQWGRHTTAAAASGGAAADAACATRARRSICRRVSFVGCQSSVSSSSSIRSNGNISSSASSSIRRRSSRLGSVKSRDLLSQVASLQRQQLLGPQRLRLLRRQLEVVGLLGEGASGVVYKVRQRRGSKKFALKIIPKESSKEDPHIACARRYAERHLLIHGGVSRHLVGLHAAFQDEQHLFLLQQLVEGQTLRALLQQRGGPLPEAEARDFAFQLVEAVHAVHRLGFLHRDIKPENIIIDDNKQLKLTDMGLAAAPAAAAAAAPAAGAPAASAYLHTQQRGPSSAQRAAPKGGTPKTQQPYKGAPPQSAAPSHPTQLVAQQEITTKTSYCSMGGLLSLAEGSTCCSLEQPPSFEEGSTCCSTEVGATSLASWRLQQLLHADEAAAVGTLHYMAPEVALGAPLRHPRPNNQHGLPGEARSAINRGPQQLQGRRPEGKAQAGDLWRPLEGRPDNELDGPQENQPEGPREGPSEGFPEGPPEETSKELPDGPIGGPSMGPLDEFLNCTDEDSMEGLMKADWWSVGAVVYECLFGFSPLGRFSLKRRRPSGRENKMAEQMNCRKGRQQHNADAAAAEAEGAAAPAAADAEEAAAHARAAPGDGQEAVDAPDSTAEATASVATTDGTRNAEAAAGSTAAASGEVVNNPELVLCMLRRFEDFIALPPTPFVVASNEGDQQQRDSTETQQRQRQQPGVSKQQQQQPVVSLEAVDFLSNLLCDVERRFDYREIREHPWICLHTPTPTTQESPPQLLEAPNTLPHSSNKANSNSSKSRSNGASRNTRRSRKTDTMVCPASSAPPVSPPPGASSGSGSISMSPVPCAPLRSSGATAPSLLAASPAAALPLAAGACSCCGDSLCVGVGLGCLKELAAGGSGLPAATGVSCVSTAAWETDFRFLGFEFNAEQRKAVAEQHRLREALEKDEPPLSEHC
ncbi:SRS47A, putative [Eimeria brunetti]|uniref:non-specific serine/threonine protein kinase n=1 Tax=Eimeria brunetti TaxID=51314 RepID=U6LNJ7_9EIME|nr:SRS47A, putative [Eimeria brunetti]